MPKLFILRLTALLATSLHSPSCCSVTLPSCLKRKMSSLVLLASLEKPLIFDGKRIHKKAFGKKGVNGPSNAALLKGVLESDLAPLEAKSIAERMNNLRKGLRPIIEHHVQQVWLDTARSLGMTKSQSTVPVESFADIIEQLESNSKIESFQNWYRICYMENEKNSGAKEEAEAKLMRDLNIEYEDGSLTGGCLADLMEYVKGKFVEHLQSRSKGRQGLHVVKSRPNIIPEMNYFGQLVPTSITAKKRRGPGSYFVVHSDQSGNMVNYRSFNVSVPREGMNADWTTHLLLLLAL